MERKLRILVGIAIGLSWAIAGLLLYGGPPAKIITPTLRAEQSPAKSVETTTADVAHAELERLRATEIAREKEQWERWQADREKQAAAHQKRLKDEERRQQAREQHERTLAEMAKAEAKERADEEMQVAVAQEQINRRLQEVNGGPPIEKPKMKRGVAGDPVVLDGGLRQYLKQQHRLELRAKYARWARKSLAARHAAVAAYEANERQVTAFHAAMRARAIRGW